MMKRDLCAVLAGATLVAASPYARAEDVGCCRTECHDANRVRMGLTATVPSECQTSAQGCRAEWSAGPCPGGARVGAGRPFGADESDESEDDPPAQR
jgi:hypothetical protein